MRGRGNWVSSCRAGCNSQWKRTLSYRQTSSCCLTSTRTYPGNTKNYSSNTWRYKTTATRHSTSNKKYSNNADSIKKVTMLKLNQKNNSTNNTYKRYNKYQAPSTIKWINLRNNSIIRRHLSNNSKVKSLISTKFNICSLKPDWRKINWQARFSHWSKRIFSWMRRSQSWFKRSVTYRRG